MKWGLSAVAVLLAAIFGSPAAPQAATRATPLIVIPPANLPPPTSSEIDASMTPAAVAASCNPSATRLQVLHDPQGTGLAMYGALADGSESATGVVLAIFAQAEPFDLAPVSQLLLADEKDRRAQGLFTADVHGAPVVGIAIAALDKPGGNVAMLYDDADAFAASFPRLQQALAPSDAVEIGISDNSVYEADTMARDNVDADWDRAIAALVEGGDARIDATLARSLADRLASDTGEPWRIVQPASFR